MRLALYTMFGLVRITLYLLVPALLMVRYQNGRVDNPFEGFEKFLLFVGTFILSWVFIIVDYYFVLKRQKVTR